MHNSLFTTQQSCVSCPTCAFTGPTDDFEHHPNNSGCWCPDCQTFIWNDPTENHQRTAIVLEQATQDSTKEDHPAVPYKFNKRLSPLRYPGGKSKLIDYLFTNLQASKLDTFVEVFAGGASFGLALLDAGIINHLVLNDADQNLINFWREVLYNPQPLLNKIQTITPTHKDYAAAKELLSSTTPPFNLLTNCTSNSSAPQLITPNPELIICAPERRTDRAWAYLLVNRLSYSGIQKAGCLGGKGGSEAALRARYNPKALVKQINHLASHKDRITLLNQDYTEVIETYYWDDHTTLFIDPPYRQKGKALYDLYFTDDDHRALAELLQSLTLEFPDCADILITYDNDPFIKGLYWHMKPIYINRRYSI